MVIEVGDKLISDELFRKEFVCNRISYLFEFLAINDLYILPIQ